MGTVCLGVKQRINKGGSRNLCLKKPYHKTVMWWVNLSVPYYVLALYSCKMFKASEGNHFKHISKRKIKL